MGIASYCRRPACTAPAHETLRVAAQRMEKDGIGSLVILDGDHPVGLLTDRDLALAVAADGRDAGATRVGDAMSRPPVSVRADDSLEDALERMARARVRRLPVVEGDRVLGVVSSDDLVMLLAREIGGLGEVLVAQLPAGARPIGREASRKEGPQRPVDHYRIDVVTVPGEATVAAAAREMREHAVGSVVVLGDGGKAAGLITDRDVALRVVAAGIDPAAASCASIMSAPLVGARPSDPLEEVVARMRTASVRRVPVLKAGRPVGMVTFDDLVVALGREFDRIGACVRAEIQETRIDSLPARLRHDLEERIEEAATRLREVGDHTLRGLGREIEGVFERVGHALRGGPFRATGTSLSAGDLMRTDVRTCTPQDSLSEAARIMWERDCGCVPVLAADGSARVVGMVTDRDVCMASYTAGGRLAEMQVETAMSPRVHACHPDDPLSEVEAVMRSRQVRRLPVVDEAGRLRGILSLADLARAADGARAPAGAVAPAEIGRALEAICRPRTPPARTP